MPLRNTTPAPRRPSMGGLPANLGGKLPIASEQDLYVTLGKALDGKLNNTAEVTLSVDPATTTDFDDPKITAASAAMIAPMTANAALVLSTTWLTVTDGRVRFNHAPSVLADLTFRLAVFG